MSAPLSGKPNQTRAPIPSLEADVAFLDNALGQLESAAGESRRKLDAIRSLVAGLRQRNLELERKASALNEAATAKEQQLVRRVNELEVAIAKGIAHAQELEKQTEWYRNALEERRASHVDQSKKNEETLSMLAQQEKRVVQLYSALEQVRAQLHTARVEKESLKTELEGRLSAAQGEQKRQAENRSALEGELERKSEDLRRTKAELAFRNEELSKLRAHQVEVRTTAILSDPKVRQIQASLEEAQAAHRNTQTQLEAAKAEIELKKSEIHGLIAQLSSAKRMQEAVQVRVEQLELSLAEMSRHQVAAEDLAARFEDSKSRCARLESSLDQRTREVEQLRRLNESLMRRLDSGRPVAAPAGASISSTVAVPPAPEASISQFESQLDAPAN